MIMVNNVLLRVPCIFHSIFSLQKSKLIQFYIQVNHDISKADL